MLQFALLETITTMLFDVRPKWRSKKPVVTLMCVIAFLIPGLLMTTQGGIYLFDLIDSYSAGFNVIILCLLELLCVMVLYGKYCVCYKRLYICCLNSDQGITD